MLNWNTPHRGTVSPYRIAALAEQLAKITHFTLDECKVLIYLHTRLESIGPLNRLRMREVLNAMFDITDDVMLDLAFKAFDRDGNNYVDDVEFVRGLSAMLRGTLDELTDWCYFIYDINGDGGLARDELAHCLKGCIVPGFGISADETESGELDIIEIAMRKLDVDKDGQISLTDFKKAVKKDPLLLEAVGPCLPPVRCCAAFLSLVTEKFRSYTLPVGKKPIKHHHRRSRFIHNHDAVVTRHTSFIQTDQHRTSILSNENNLPTIPERSEVPVVVVDHHRLSMEEHLSKAQQLSVSVTRAHNHSHTTMKELKKKKVEFHK